MSTLREMMGEVIGSEKVHRSVCQILNGWGDVAVCINIANVIKELLHNV
jgi:putative heme iron utilization protein